MMAKKRQVRSPVKHLVLLPGLLLGCIALFGNVALVTAQPSAQSPQTQAAAPAPADRFARMDADGSGGISPQEFTTAVPNMTESAFTAIDVDRDGQISRAEWDAFMQRHQQPGGMGSGGMSRGMGGMRMPPSDMPGGAGGGHARPLIMPPAGK